MIGYQASARGGGARGVRQAQGGVRRRGRDQGAHSRTSGERHEGGDPRRRVRRGRTGAMTRPDSRGARARWESMATKFASREIDARILGPSPRVCITRSSLYSSARGSASLRPRLPLRLFLRAFHDLIGHALLPPVLSPVVHHPQHRSPHDEERDDVGEDEDGAQFAELHGRSDDVDGLGGFLGGGDGGGVEGGRDPRSTPSSPTSTRGAGAGAGAGAERFTSMPDSSRESLTMSPMDWPPESRVKTHSMGWPASAGAGAASATQAARESATPRAGATTCDASSERDARARTLARGRRGGGRRGRGRRDPPARDRATRGRTSVCERWSGLARMSVASAPSRVTPAHAILSIAIEVVGRAGWRATSSSRGARRLANNESN